MTVLVAARVASVASDKEYDGWTVASDGIPATCIKVAVPGPADASPSTYGVLVRIPGACGSTEGCPVKPGEIAYFRYGNRKISNVKLQGDGGTATNVVCCPCAWTGYPE